MGITLKQIADIAGVSRGTVDRVIHNRGRVNPQTAKLILKIADELGYQPNRVGRALALSRNPISIGIVVQSSNTPFMKTVIEGIEQAAVELQELGAQILTEYLDSVDAGEIINAMNRLLDQGVNGIAITAVDSEDLRSHINFLVDELKIPVITFNSDLPDTKRLCYVGQDSFKSGQTSAYLMSLAIRKSGTVFPITGHLTNVAHRLRYQGFNEEISKYLGIELLPLQSCLDEDQKAYDMTIKVLQENPELTAIFIIANGQQGVCQALKDSGKKSQVTVIAYDLTPQNIELMNTGYIDLLIGQGAAEQGSKPPFLLYNYLLKIEKLEQELLHTDIVIKTKYNI